MSGCVQNIVNTMVFVRFAVLQKFEFPVSRGRIWASFWEAFGDHRITFLCFLGVPERCWNLDGFSMSAVGPERSRHIQARGGSADNRSPNFPSRTLP